MPSTASSTGSLLEALKYIDPITGVGDQPVRDFETFREAAKYDAKQYSIFVSSLFLSLDDIEDPEVLSRTFRALQQALHEIQESRALNGRFRAFPRAENYAATSKAAREINRQLNAELLTAGTIIGPIILGDDTPVSEVVISEEYDTRMLKTLRGITDPVFKGHRNRIMMTLTIEFPGHAIERLRRLIATLRVAPITEIVSDAIVPVFLNGVLTPERAKQITEDAMLRAAGSGRSVQDEVRSLIEMDNVPVDPEWPSSPAGAPDVGTLGAPKTVTNIVDGDTFRLSGDTEDTRLIGVDTFESGTERGDQATAYLQSLIPVGTQVYVEAGVEDRDVYNRHLRYIYLADGTQVNLRVAQSGHGLLFVLPPNDKYERDYRRATSKSRMFKNFKDMVGSFDPLVGYVSSTAPVRSPESVGSRGPIAVVSQAPKPKSLAISAAFVGALVYTMPGKTNALTAKLTFTKFNDNAFQGGKVLYRDAIGNKTTDATLCPWIERLAEFTYLSDHARDSRQRVHYMAPYTFPADGESLMEFTWEDPETLTEQSFKTDPTHFVIEDISVQSTMKAVTIPLAGQVYPVVQYLGAENMVATVQVVVTDRLELAKLHEMKSELDRINYLVGPLVRNHKVSIKNNVLNLMGARDFVVSKIDTSIDAQRNASTVTMQLVESRLSPEDVESISLLNNEAALKQDAKKVWDYIYELLSAKNWQAVGPIDSEEPPVVEETFVTPENAVGFSDTKLSDLKQAYALIFGRNKDGVETILSPNALAATYYSLAMKSVSGKSYVSQWDTSDKNSLQTLVMVFGGGLETALTLQTMDERPVDFPELTGYRSVATPQGARGSFTATLVGAVDPLSLFGDPREVYRTVQGVERPLLHTNRIAAVDLLRWPGDGRNQVQSRGEDMLAAVATAFRDRLFFTKEAWDEYFDVVMGEGRGDGNDADPSWTEADLAGARSALYGLVSSGIFLRFQGLDLRSMNLLGMPPDEVIVSVSPDEVSRGQRPEPRASNYADIRLPTYAEFFKNPPDVPGGLQSAADGSDRSREIPLWKRFAPTYSDLGKPAPFDLSLALQDGRDVNEIVARTPNDPVEPDIVYYHERVKGAAVESEIASEDRLLQALGHIMSHTLFTSSEEAKNNVQNTKQFIRQLLDSPDRVRLPEAHDQQRNRELLRDLTERRANRVLFATSGEGQPQGVLLQGEQGGEAYKWRSITGVQPFLQAMDGPLVLDPPHSGDYLLKNYRRFAEGLPDRTFSMVKAFPAYRLYFIEEDQTHAYLVDDLYGVNCVAGLSLRKDKDDADVLTVQLTNVTDNLGTEALLDFETANNLGLAKDDEGEQYLSKLKLQSGVTLQLRMGYGSDPNDLDIVFTGMITEVQPGKMVTVVAQGHKRELLNEVQFVDAKLSYFDVIRTILELCEHPHLGRQERVKAVSDATLREMVGPSAEPGSLYGWADKFFNVFADSATQNVFIEGSYPTLGSTTVPTITTSSSDVNSLADSSLGAMAVPVKIAAFGLWLKNQLGGSDRRSRAPVSWLSWVLIPGWVCPPQPAWEALQEVVRHFPGHVMDVLPRGTGATLFVGRPDQAYHAEDAPPLQSFLHAKASALIATKAKVDVEAEILGPFLRPDNAPHGDYVRGADSLGLAPTSGQSKKALIQPRGPVEWLAAQGRLENAFLRDTLGVDILGTDSLANNDLTEAWDGISKVHPEAMKVVFYWYYGIDPQKAVTSNVETGWRYLRNLFLSDENKDYQNFREALADGAGLFSSNLAGVTSPRVWDARAITLEDEAIKLRERTGQITPEEAQAALAAVQERVAQADSAAAQRLARDVVPDPAIEEIRDAVASGKSIAQALTSTGASFKLFVYYLWQDVRLRTGEQEFRRFGSAINAAKVSRSLSDLKAASLPPGWKIFRNYHKITSRDIIENNIVATQAEMANCVLIRAPQTKIFNPLMQRVLDDPVEFSTETYTDEITGEEKETVVVDYEDTDWISFPTNDGLAFNEKIARKNRKLAVIPELNAITDDQKSKTLMSNMAAVLRPMYRGNLIVTGRHVKPYDLIDLRDDDKDVRGLIEVASVVHHYTADMGWISVIEPHALSEVDNPTGRIQISTFQQLLDQLSPIADLMDTALIILSIAGVLAAPFTGGGSLAATSGATAARTGLMAGARAAMASAVRSGMTKLAGQKAVGAAARWAQKPLLEFIGRNALRAAGGLAGARFGHSLARMYSQVSLHNQIGSTILPITLSPLVYRGNLFAAGLEADDSDIYSFEDLFSHWAMDTKRDIGDWLHAVSRDLSGKGSLSPIDRFMAGEQER